MKFEQLYENQVNFQKEILAKKENQCILCGEPEFKPSDFVLPKDDVEWFKYHCLAMMEEMGEVLQADKRWKTHRNERLEKDEKLDELSDVFITFLNICMYSGFESEQIVDAISKKINKNIERLHAHEK